MMKVNIEFGLYPLTLRFKKKKKKNSLADVLHIVFVSKCSCKF